MKKYIYPFLALGLMTACVEDEGNYNYKHLNVIEIEGIEESYAPLAYMDNVKISPVLSGSLAGTDLSNYEYQWHFCINTHASHVVISNEKDLDWHADIAPGTYSLYFTVKDRTTGLEKQQRTTLNVGSPFLRGFLVLGDDMETGQVRLDMLCMPQERDTAYAESVITDPIGLVGAREMVFSGYGSANEDDQFLWLLSDHYAHRLTFGETLSYIDEFNESGLVELEIPHQTPMQVRDVFPRQGSKNAINGTTQNRARTYRGLILDDAVVFCNVSSGGYGGAINRYSAVSNNYFKPYPKAFIQPTIPFNNSNLLNALVYDTDNQCFARMLGAYSTYMEKITDYYPGGTWNLEIGQDNRTMVYGENGLNLYNGDNPVYILAKDNDADNYYVMYFSGHYSNLTRRYYPTKSPLYAVNKAVAVDIDKASHYMFSSNRLVLLYSVGNRLYQYDYTRGTCISHEFDGDITYLESDYSSECSIKEYFLATYNDATGKGIIYKMEVPDIANAGFRFLDGQQWETTLKVKDIEWKWPN